MGKTRLALSPVVNHWWQVPLYVTPRGLTTSSIPYPAGAFEVLFDFHRHQLGLYTSDGQARRLPLVPQSVAEFYWRYQALLQEAGIAVDIWPVPVEVEDATPFPDDQHPNAYDANAAQRFWQVLLHANQLLTEFRSRFTGKVSPVHFFWGSFDLAVARFSGRPAPPHPGVPGRADWVTREAYSDEMSSAGGRAATGRKRPSTATPTPTRPALRRPACGPARRYSTRSSVSLCYPTSKRARTKTRAKTCWTFCKAPTRPPLPSRTGPVRPWSAPNFFWGCAH